MATFTVRDVTLPWGLQEVSQQITNQIFDAKMNLNHFVPTGENLGPDVLPILSRSVARPYSSVDASQHMTNSYPSMLAGR